ncbi:pyridoxal phosphate-dependent transferase [Exophiala viscosa]|uniref:pyridoxal phosphate-dependent transferase n=1 Tax=Exophiala viscosa TaxID=2486360 RepID=UPI0021A05166|nr:pyridoxal phosphate-dependent transferase [Exophiala viscosa]
MPSSKVTDSPSSAAMLHRSVHHRPHEVVTAKGIYLTLASGQVVIDACGGAAVCCIGHGNEEVLEAVTRQMKTGASYIHSMSYTTPAAEQLAELLIHGPQGGARFGLEKALFVNSGSEAADAAMKLARQYFFEQGQTQRTKFVARKQGFHGSTIGAMNISSNLPRKVPFTCFQKDNVSWVTPAYAYQYSKQGETDEDFTARLLAELDAHFQELGPDTVVAFMAETIVGATSGCTTAPAGYFKGVRQICDKYGILLILDEVMCGMGRTGTPFAFEQEGEGVVPDILTVAKGLGGGYSPIAGLLVHKRVVDVLRKHTGSFNHGHTYQAHPVGCAATLRVQQIIQRDGLIKVCAQRGKLLESLLKKTFSDVKLVGDIRGRGLFWGIEFVQDKTTREPFPAQMAIGVRYQSMVFDLGVAVYPGMATVDGTKGDHVLLAPPYNVTEDELRVIVQVMKRAYDKLEKELDMVTPMVQTA